MAKSFGLTTGGNLLVAQEHELHIMDTKTKNVIRDTRLEEKITDMCTVPFEK